MKGWRAICAQTFASSAVVVITSIAAGSLARSGIVMENFYWPRAGGMWMNSQGLGGGQTGPPMCRGPLSLSSAPLP